MRLYLGNAITKCGFVARSMCVGSATCTILEEPVVLKDRKKGNVCVCVRERQLYCSAW